MELVETAKRWLAAAGFKVTRFPPPYSLPWQIRRILDRVPVDGIIDVGAHEGEFARLLRRDVGFDGPIVSFEPAPASFAALVQAMAHDARRTGHRMALGAEAGELTMNLFPEPRLNSFLRPNSFGRTMFAPELDAGSTSETVSVGRLDEVTGLPDGTVVLKVDTQGFDMQVVAGAQGLLPRTVALVLEMPVRPIYEGAVSIGDMLAELSRLDYELVGLFPVTRDHDAYRVIEFDGVFVRTDVPVQRHA